MKVFLLVFSSIVLASPELTLHKVKSFDNFELSLYSEIPKGASKIFLLIHGSGPHNYQGSTQGLNVYDAFKTPLLEAGQGVLRFNKRSYQIKEILKENPAYLKSEQYKKFEKEALHYFIKDVISIVEWTKKKLPNLEIFLMGHSQGTYIALQVAHLLKKEIKGIFQIGAFTQDILTIVYEQTVGRQSFYFDQLDSNHDQSLELSEISDSSQDDTERKELKKSFREQFKILDLNSDETISKQELIGVVLDSYYEMKQNMTSYAAQELSYPGVEQIVSELEIPLYFFHGQWDNQTKVEQIYSLQFLNRYQWKKKNLHFYIFPKLGHILHEQSQYMDLSYKAPSKIAMEKIKQTALNL